MINEVLPEEIKRAVFTLKSDSSGGPDGFNAFFYQNTWKIVKSDVIKATQYFFCHNKLPTGVNATNIALVPKCSNPVVFLSLDLFHVAMFFTKSYPR